jgi:hypothetical protein
VRERNSPVSVNGLDEFETMINTSGFDVSGDLLMAGEFSAFRFDASLLRAQPQDVDTIKDVITKVLDRGRFGQGFLGLALTNMKAAMIDDVQHSSFFGEWMTIGAWIAAGMGEFLETAVLNERGHIFYAPDVMTGGAR